jgi:hypothetical protein
MQTIWTGHVRYMRNVYNVLVGYFGGKRPFRRSSHRCEDGIKWASKKHVRMWTGLISVL